MLGSHLMDGAVRPLNGQLHQVFNVFAVGDLIPETVVQNIDGLLRSDLARIRATDAVGDHKDAAGGIGQKRVLVHRPLLAQSSIADRSDLDIVCGFWCAHWTASRAIASSDPRLARATALASWALRWEKAINIPSMAKLVIKLNPPWLTNGKVIPVMGNARVMPPIFTSA